MSRAIQMECLREILEVEAADYTPRQVRAIERQRKRRKDYKIALRKSETAPDVDWEDGKQWDYDHIMDLGIDSDGRIKVHILWSGVWRPEYQDHWQDIGEIRAWDSKFVGLVRDSMLLNPMWFTTYRMSKFVELGLLFLPDGDVKLGKKLRDKKAAALRKEREEEKAAREAEAAEAKAAKTKAAKAAVAASPAQKGASTSVENAKDAEAVVQVVQKRKLSPSSTTVVAPKRKSASSRTLTSLVDSTENPHAAISTETQPQSPVAVPYYQAPTPAHGQVYHDWQQPQPAYAEAQHPTPIYDQQAVYVQHYGYDQPAAHQGQFHPTNWA